MCPQLMTEPQLTLKSPQKKPSVPITISLTAVSHRRASQTHVGTCSVRINKHRVFDVHQTFRGHSGLVTVFSAILAFKIALFLQIGPIFTPDSFGYSQLAAHLLAGSDWLIREHLDWNLNAPNGEPVTIFRILGYPLILALAKSLSSQTWAGWIIGIQGVLSLVATFYVYRLTIKLSNSNLVALFVAFAHGTGQTLLFDQCILTDSLNASFLLLMLCHVGLGILNDRRPSYIEAAALGTLVMLAFFLREAGSYLQVLYWPLILYWGLRVLNTKVQALLLVAVFALPMMLGVQAYKSWNEMRTGVPFITVGGSTAMFFPPVYLEQRGVSVFADDPLLGDMGPLHQSNSTVAIIRRTIITHLIREHNFDMHEVAQYGMSNFLRYWQTHTLEMGALTLSHIREKQALLPVMPISAIERAVLWTSGLSPFPAKGQLVSNLVNDYRVDQLLMVGARTIAKIISIIITMAFILGVPFVAIRSIRHNGIMLNAHDPSIVLASIYWLIYFGYTFVYAMIHLEMRYLMPVAPLTLIIGVTLLTTLARTYGPFKQPHGVRG